MAKQNKVSSLPKMHTLRRGIAEEVYHLVYSGQDKNFRKTKTREIEEWLAQQDFLVNESPLELAKEWQERNRGRNE